MLREPVPSTRRLFFAFWPDELQRAAAVTASQRLFPLSGRPVPPENLHVTAAFLGPVAEERVAKLRALAGPVRRFELEFDRLEHWRRSETLVAVASQPPEAVERCIAALWKGLDRLGFARESRRYVPHLTLARDVRQLRAGMTWPTIRWRIEDLRLVESKPGPGGSRYEPL